MPPKQRHIASAADADMPPMWTCLRRGHAADAEDLGVLVDVWDVSEHTQESGHIGRCRCWTLLRLVGWFLDWWMEGTEDGRDGFGWCLGIHMDIGVWRCRC